MHPDSDHIHWLMIEQLTGEISEADERYLSSLLDSDPAVREAYKVLQEQYAREDLETKFARLKFSESWKPMPTLKYRQHNAIRRKLIGIAAAAAILTGILVTVYVINNQKSSSSNEVLTTTISEGNGIKLHVAGGKTLDLSNNTGQTTLGNGTLLNGSRDSLTFIVGSDKNGTTAINTLSVPVGMDYKVLLSDGTMVWLNSSSILKFPFNFLDAKREISIEGEAYIEVTRNSKKPFIVHTPHGSINVLGTGFNINTYDPQTLRVSLVEGSVQVEAAEKPVTLKQGQEAVYDAAQKHLKVQDFDEEEVLSWRQGIHLFYDNTVQEICEVFPRWYGVSIVIDNKSITNRTFTGILNRKEPIDKFLRALKATSSINEYELKDGVLHLR